MVRIDADTTSLDRFIQLLEKTSTEFIQNRQRELMDNMTEDVVRSMQYPAETAANSPPPYPYYERGLGSVSRSGAILYTSGDLKSNWQKSVNISGNTVTGRVGNTTVGRHAGGGVRSYSSYVHGVPRAANISLRQAMFHTQRGWPSLLHNAQSIAGERAQVTAVNPTDSPDDVAQDFVNRLENF